ncbi:type II toxin-antitoxin system HicB family antitoxin [Pseudochelatococcus contaminans]|uniref:Putative RNase H-like HicB family nuclease n=1 Tax=Pseudochelatococcus contaminans TaxID=1538103 RepID=A0A7W5Z276_9HYPH|nr:type II toxin-antitoxin system HicB family antitoxin [Pseudochelatococcus contaminans]MBB3808750.1 putative RNase H-like HicB family nuclease [Pseudochelatococcus contaminans]
MRYVAFIHKDPGSDYGVSFPDFPGCISAGSTVDEAVANAIEALSGHVAVMVADGDEIPPPRALDGVLADPEFAEEREGATYVYVPLIRERGAWIRVNVSMDSGLVEAIDAAAKQRGLTRSAFLAAAARKEIEAAA